MDLKELDSYRLADAVKFHSELNPALWDGKQIRPEVHEALLRIAHDFQEFMGIGDIALKDITVSGSNAAYSYTPHSDVDLHLVVDMDQLNPDEVYREMFDAKKNQYNREHDIKIRDYDVEVYVQDSNKPVKSLGEYSLIKDDWIRIPTARRANIDEKATRLKFEKLGHLVELALKSRNLAQVKTVLDTLKKYRQAGLDEHGEFGPENLAYKILRKQGLIQQLFDLRNQLKDQELSIDETKEKKKRLKYGQYGFLTLPGYSTSQDDNDGDVDGTTADIDETVTVSKLPLVDVMTEFAHFCAKQLDLKSLPKIKLTNMGFSDEQHTFGRYVNDRKTIEVEVADRHIMDVMRTLAHELVHYWQHQTDNPPPSAGNTGSHWENEAHAKAGVIMRHFQNRYPKFFDAGVVDMTALDEQLGIAIGQEMDEGKLSRTLGAAAVSAALAGGAHAQSNIVGPGSTAYNLYNIAKLAHNAPQIFSKSNIDNEISGVARQVARGNIPGQQQAQGQLISANARGESKDAAYQNAWRAAQFKAQQQGIDASTWTVRDTRFQNEGDSWVAMVLLQEPLREAVTPVTPVPQVVMQKTRATQQGKIPRKDDPTPRNLELGQTKRAVDSTNIGAMISQIDLAKKLGVREASGYIPTWAQAKDPRFKTALTVDVRPGQLGKEANKLGLKVDSQGRPDVLMNELENQLREFKETGDITDLLTEVNMSPSALMKFATSPEAQGIRAGFEAELIFRNTNGDDDDYEADYDMDERCRSIQGIVDFFEGGDSPNSQRQLDRLQEQLDEAYYEWYDERMYDAFRDEQDDLIRKIIVDDEFDREDFINNYIEKNYGADAVKPAFDAANEAPKFTTSKSQAEYIEANPAYSNYIEADEAADAEIDNMVENEIESQGSIYDTALDDFRDNFYIDDDSGFFSDKGWRWMSDIANEFDVEWPYYTGGSNGGDRDPESIGDSLHNAIGMQVRVSGGYHSSTRKPDLWIIEPDGSLDPDDREDTGLEVVSPPLPLLATLEKLQQVIDWANDSDEGNAYTNSSTGLHMGVSVPYAGGNVDVLKLILFMGDEYVLDSFGRQANTYCRSAMGKVKDNLKTGRADVAGAMELMKHNLIELANRAVQKGVGKDKYTSVHVQDGYIEFRSPGGDWLAEESADPEKLQNTMLRFARAMFIASRPDLERKVYYKKLYKLVAPMGDDALRLFAEYSTGQINREDLKARWAEATLKKEVPSYSERATWRLFDPRGVAVSTKIVDSTEEEAWEEAKREVSPGSSMLGFKKAYNLVNLSLNTGRWEIYNVDNGETLEIVDADSRGRAADQVFDYYTSKGIGFEVRPVPADAPAKPLSRRAEIAKRIKTTKLTKQQAIDNERDSLRLRATVGEPVPAFAAQQAQTAATPQAQQHNWELYQAEEPENILHRLNNATADEVRAFINQQEQGGMPPGFLRVRQVN